MSMSLFPLEKVTPRSAGHERGGRACCLRLLANSITTHHAGIRSAVQWTCCTDRVLGDRGAVLETYL
jgi:hypothetical protein